MQMLPFVNEKSFGILSVVPKDKDGKPVDDFEDQIIYMNDQQEIKEWYAIANYIKSFDQVDGVPQIPAYYDEPHDRKVVEHDSNILAILKNPNGIILTVYAVVIGFVVLVALLVLFIIKRRKRKKATVL